MYIFLVMQDGEPQTAWFELDNANQQAYKSNKEIESLNIDLKEAGEELMPLTVVVSIAIQDATVLPHILATED